MSQLHFMANSRGVVTTQPPMLSRLQQPLAEAANSSTGRAGKTRLRARVLQIFCGTHALALVDQAVFSGTSFLTTVLVGRWTSPGELGVYSIGTSLLATSLAIQDLLILLPYIIQRHRPLGTPAEHAGGSLLLNSVLSAIGVVILAAAALGVCVRGAEPELVAMIWVLAVAVPFVLLREFGRGFAFAHLQVTKALILDVAVAATHLAALGALEWTGLLSAATACAALGGACALSGIAWLYFDRANFVIRLNQARVALKRSWGLGKWLCAGQITNSVQSNATYWLLPSLIGLPATGVYAACMSIASLANPLVAAFRNLLTPRAVLAFSEGGGVKLRRQAIRDSLLLTSAMALFCVVIFFAGEDVMRPLYRGEQYEGYGHIITVLAVAILASAAGTAATNALASMERPRAIVYATSVGTVITIVLVWFSALEWGLVGAAYGFLAGNVAGAVARWVAFLVVVSRCGPGPNPEADPSSNGMSSDRAGVMRVLQQRATPE